MRSFVIFNNSVIFSKNKVWDIKDIKHKCPETEIEPIMIGCVDVVFGHKKMQKGLMFMAEDEGEALKRLEEWKDRIEEYS